MRSMSRVIVLIFALFLVFGAFAAAQEIRINFQDKDTPVPEGWLPDYHEEFGPKDNGLVYGWEQAETMARNRDAADPPQANTWDILRSTMTHMRNGKVWEIELENGLYDVEICVGEAWGTNISLKAENVIFWHNVKTRNREWLIKSMTVEVTDGRLTLNPLDAAKWETRICWIVIKPNTTGEPMPE
ncbi:MAG: hypothetical protein GX228_05935 [Firmicutes bacterium]|jgi:hypothetical protein|nr:hypothetical protein [Bacillota bacterium]NLL88463.1 hypothetical protein [Bacillota bacterium]HKM16877.1 hypothetical protein [Limnochordia bacterium]